MKQIAKMWVLAATLLVSTWCQAQTPDRWRTTHMSYMMNESTEWSEWSACSLLVVHSGQRITIYSETTQTYDILWSTEEYTDSSGFQTMDFRAVNEEGKTVDCNLTHVIRKDPVSEELHLYLRLPTFTIAYALAEIE